MELVLQAPGIALEQSRRKTVGYGNRLIKIGNSEQTADRNHIYDNIQFATLSTKETISLIHEGESIDALLVSPENINADFISLKEEARKKAIPVILHTPSFEPTAKKTP
jgi:hypothetical protein